MNLDKNSNFHKAFTDLQRCFSDLAHNLTNHPLFHPNPPPFFKTHLENALSTLHSHATNHAPWARIARNDKPFRQPAKPMTTEAIEERLEGVPLYALISADEEFLLVSGASTGKNLGLFCFKKEDAEALLEQVTGIDPHRREGSKVVPVALNKVFQLKVKGVAFRLIPEYAQVKNALQERKKSGLPSNDFPGVPVFQSRSLIFKSQNKRYRPFFFRKEDLENSLQRASHQQNLLNPSLRKGDIEVAVLEDVINQMKENSASNWDDVIFIPPGYEVSTDPNDQ